MAKTGTHIPTLASSGDSGMDNIETLIVGGDLAGVRRALSADPDLVMRPAGGAPSPLLLAVYYGAREIADLLREAKPSLSIWESAAVGDRHQLQELIAHKPAEVDEVSSDGFTPLGFAAFFGHLECAALLLEHGANPNLASGEPMRVTPLHSALAGGHKSLAALLIRHGANVSISSGSGWTPLHYVAEKGDIETAMLLLNHGATLDRRRDDGLLPAEVAQAKGFADLAQML